MSAKTILIDDCELDTNELVGQATGIDASVLRDRMIQSERVNACIVDGKVVAIVGTVGIPFMEGSFLWIVRSRRAKRHMLRIVRFCKAFVKRCGSPIYVQIRKEDSDPRFPRLVGFSPYQGEVWRHE